MLTNKITKKRYIGKSHDLVERIVSYHSKDYLKSKKNSLICKALLKFGSANFKFTIIEYCDQDIISRREQHFIDKLKPQYNIRRSVHKENNTKNDIKKKEP